MEDYDVYKIAAADSAVRELLTSEGWEPQGKDEEMEMDSYRKGKSRKRLFVEDISEDFAVTFLMGNLSLEEFGDISQKLVPDIGLLEVESSWEGRPTTIVVAMTEEQVREMFGKRTKMREVLLHS